jgi:hypothetical protein
LDVLSNIRRMSFTKVRAINHLGLDLLRLGLEVVERFTAVEHKGDTEMVEPVVEVEAVYLADADRVEKLLDVIMNTVNMPNVPCIRAAAQNELAQIEHDLWVQMYPEQAEAEEARLKAAQEAEEARLSAKEELTDEEKEALLPGPQPRDTLAQPVERRV